MSSVNKVSKNNVLYNLEDSRTAIVELTNITWESDVEGETTIASDDFDKLINAENGIIIFTNYGSVISTNIVNKMSSQNMGLVIAQGMLYMNNTLNSITIYAQYEGTKPQAITTMISIAVIETGGGSGGDGVPVIEFDNVEYEYEDGYYMAGVIPTEQQYNTALNNDVVVIKVIDDNGEIMVFTKTMVIEDGGEEASIIFGSFNPEEVGMAYIAKADDGEGGYIYQAMLMKGSMPSGDTTLYAHDITLSGFVINGMSLEATLKVISKESSTYDYMQDVLNSYIYNGITSMVLQLGMDIPGDNETIHQVITTPVLGFLNISGDESVQNLEFLMEGSITDIDINDLTITQDYVNTL